MWKARGMTDVCERLIEGGALSYPGGYGAFDRSCADARMG